MDLDEKQRKMLRVGLSQAFFTYEDFRRFLRGECGGFDLNQVTHAGEGLLKVLDTAIDTALTSGWNDLMLAACAAHTNPDLKSVAVLLQRQLANSRPIFYGALQADPFAALFLGKEQCFIGRSGLRSELADMQVPQEERRVLVVNGGGNGGACTGCGKTYTYGLLRLLDRLGNGNVVVKIDFREFREGDLGSRYRDIIEKINVRMKVPADQLPKMNESQTRWFQNAIDKFEVVAREQGKKLWLVFDHVGFTEIEDKIADALASTAIYTISEASALHVVLIDVDPARLKLEAPIRMKLRSDSAQLPARDDLVGFLKDARTMSGKSAILDEEIDKAATKILGELAAVAEAERAYQYSRLTWKSAVQLGFVS